MWLTFRLNGILRHVAVVDGKIVEKDLPPEVIEHAKVMLAKYDVKVAAVPEPKAKPAVPSTSSRATNG